MSNPPGPNPNLPGNGWLGWLGRQVGHVKKAVQTDVDAPKPRVVYREDTIEEHEHPEQPGVKFRRTTIDEIVVEPAPRLNEK